MINPSSWLGHVIITSNKLYRTVKWDGCVKIKTKIRSVLIMAIDSCSKTFHSLFEQLVKNIISGSSILMFWNLLNGSPKPVTLLEIKEKLLKMLGLKYTGGGKREEGIGCHDFRGEGGKYNNSVQLAPQLFVTAMVAILSVFMSQF